MAKEEKSKGKEKPSGESHDERARRVLIEIFALALFVFLISRLVFIYSTDSDIRSWFAELFQNWGLLELWHSIIFYLTAIGIVAAALFAIAIIYLVSKLRGINKIWHGMLHPAGVGVSEKNIKNEKWQRILSHISSSNSSDWRLAILECDIVLDDLFDTLGYVGGTIGDKLKSVDPAHFKTLNNAWEAHKIRNAIAHEGQDFNMTDREARRVVGLYESVFREFDFI